MNRKLLKIIATTKRLTPLEKISTRIGYMGAGFLVAAQWTLEPKLYIAGFICVMVQTAARKQWNLVALNINGLIAWIGHLISNIKQDAACAIKHLQMEKNIGIIG